MNKEHLEEHNKCSARLSKGGLLKRDKKNLTFETITIQIGDSLGLNH